MNSETEFELKIPININELNQYKTPEFILKRLSWRAETKKETFRNVTKLTVNLHCNIQEPCTSDWSCIATAEVRLVSSQETVPIFQKKLHFIHFNPEHSTHGMDQYITWEEIERYATHAQITLNMKIQAIGLSNSNNLVNLTSLPDEKQLKVQVTFREIQTTFAAISPEITYHGLKFKICIFKRPYVKGGQPYRKRDALWFYLCCHVGDIQQSKCSYDIRLLTHDENIGALCSSGTNAVFSASIDSYGAPFVDLDDLLNPQNRYEIYSLAFGRWQSCDLFRIIPYFMFSDIFQMMQSIWKL